MIEVLTPFEGEVVGLADVPDPVFAQQIVGAGVAVEPSAEAESVTAVAPVSGTIVKLHPHAFAIEGTSGVDVLVHIGIDTVKLQGRGFELLARENEPIEAGAAVVRFEPQVIRAAGYSAICPVVVLGSAADSVDQATVGRALPAGATLFATAALR